MVLIAGETGTGKELIARAIHYLGKLDASFVAVSCACQPTLIEDEVFGHERGAFTDAHVRRVGLLAHADRGTLFLDEVDALSSSAQAALLRVLQDKRYRPVDSNDEQQADVRIVAATNARLDSLPAGRFRSTCTIGSAICDPGLRTSSVDGDNVFFRSDLLVEH